MLAGDEIAPDDPSTLRATGFLARNWYKFNRNIWLDNTVEHTSKAFLGLTVACARCHDHKYDPIPQADYYRFRAFFEPIEVAADRVPGQPDTDLDGLARVYDAHADRPTYLYRRGDEKQPDEDHPSTRPSPGPSAPSRRSPRSACRRSPPIRASGTTSAARPAPRPRRPSTPPVPTSNRRGPRPGPMSPSGSPNSASGPPSRGWRPSRPAWTPTRPATLRTPTTTASNS